MPSAKPDKNEIKLLRWKRRLGEPPHNLFSEIFFQCRSALDGGYITPERGKRLLDFLDSNVNVAAIFPNNLLRRLLSDVLTRDQWSLEIEAILLDFIAQLYLGTRIENRVPIGLTFSVGPDYNVKAQPISIDGNPESVKPPDDTEYEYFLASLMKSTNPLFLGVSELIYDSMPVDLTIKDCFVGFTGDFRQFTRKTCFEGVRKLGGVPCDPYWFLDFMFVSDESYDRRIISRKLSAAIYCRRVYGNPLILRETDWIKVASSETT